MKRKTKRTYKRRRHEGKTDYKARFNLLKSRLPRIVVRKTNKYVLVQYVESENAKDKVICGTSSKDLLEYGWPKELSGSLKSLPACYLTGLLFAKKVKEKIKKDSKKEEKAILDIGLAREAKKGRLYSVLKGFVDYAPGVKVNYKEGIFPDEKRIKGEHLKVKSKINFDKIKDKILG